jgi:hypothetical protein
VRPITKVLEWSLSYALCPCTIGSDVQWQGLVRHLLICQLIASRLLPYAYALDNDPRVQFGSDGNIYRGSGQQE